MAKKQKIDLTTLPQHIIRKSSKWYVNTRTGSWIPAARITDYLPKTPPTHQDIIAKRWDLKVETHELMSDEGVYVRTVELH